MKSSLHSACFIGLLALLACSQQQETMAFTTPLSFGKSSSPRISPLEAPSYLQPTQTFSKPSLSSSSTATPTKTATSLSAIAAVPTALSALPLWQKIAWSCLLPPCLGFYKNEYGVSYAYGTATALTSFWIYKALGSSGKTMVASWHAGALMFYGIRLCLFLGYRELFIQRIRDSIKNIEDKATGRGNRLKRAPFLLSCGGLYFGLCAPLLITSQVDLTAIPKWTMTLIQTLIGATWAGFLLGALGDFNKSIVKAIKGENHLVTGGIYRFFRHPNYTGEIIGWTANALTAIVAAIASKGIGFKPWPLFGYVFASVMGAAGLDFVLIQATGGLEKRQKEAYGDSEEYKEWVEKSWIGFPPPPKAVEEAIDEVVDPHAKPEIKPKVDEKEGGGTGI